MKKLAIITDDNAGFRKEEVEKLKDLYILGMPTLIGGETFYEGVNLTAEEFYQALEEGKDVKTSQPIPGNVITLWEKLLEEYEYIIHVPMSGGLSQSTNSAKMYAKEYNGRVIVVDNHRVSVTLKRSIYDAFNLANRGVEPEEIKNILEETKSLSTIYIMVDTLKYLKKGGRVTAAGALLGATLHVKPVLTILGGALDAKAKSLGSKKARLIMLNALKEDIHNLFGDNLQDLEFSVAYTFDEDKAIEFKEQIETALGVKVTHVDPLSLSIATHIGPGSLACTISKIIK